MKTCFSLFCLLLGLASFGKPAAAEIPPAAVRLFSEPVEVWCLRDSFGQMSGKIFSKPAGEPVPPLPPSAQTPAGVNMFFIRLQGHNILVDTGRGGSDSHLPAALRQLGLSPEQIDVILLTHAHPDHVGGLLDADGQLRFPRAAVYISPREQEHWQRQPESRASQVLQRYAGQLRPLHPGDILFGQITVMEAFGHTPGHLVFALPHAYITGDLIHAAAWQFPHPELCAIYDLDREQAVASRRRFLAHAAADGRFFLGMHIPFPGCVTVHALPSGGYRSTPAPIAP